MPSTTETQRETDDSEDRANPQKRKANSRLREKQELFTVAAFSPVGNIQMAES